MNSQSRRGRRLRTALALLALVTTPAVAQAPPAATRAADSVAAVEAYLRAQMALNDIPALSVAIVRDGRTALLAAYGTANPEWQAAATPATAYQLASATKPLTGTLVMRLVQEGRLALDASVTYGGKPVLWRFELEADGRLRSLRPFPL